MGQEARSLQVSHFLKPNTVQAITLFLNFRRNDNSHRNGHNENGISEDRHHFRGDRGSNDHFQGFKHENNRSSNGEYERAANSKNRYIHPNQRDYGNHGAENEAGDVAPRFRKMNFNQTSQSVSTPFAGAPNLSVPPPNPFQQIPKDVEASSSPQNSYLNDDSNC